MMENLPEFLTNPDPYLYYSDHYVVLDFETTSVGKGLALYPENRIVLAVWKYDGELKVRRAGEYDLRELVEDCQKADFVIAQNAKFELQWLDRCGLDLSNVLVYDTQIGEYVLGGNRWVHQQVSLENIARRRWGEGKSDVVSKMIKAGFEVDEIPEKWLEEYCVRDVELTEKLYREQVEELERGGLLPVLYNRCLLTPVLADIEKNGVTLDADLVRTRLQETESEYAASAQDLERITGGINTNSPKQLATFLYEDLGFEELREKRGGEWTTKKTPSGQPLTDQESVAKLRPKSKLQREFLEIYKRNKELFNRLSKYLRSFDACCREAGGILHASFNQTATRTHRLSSSGLDYSCQFQNFPRAYKSLFTARYDGWLVGESDGAQLEFRTAVHLGRDSVGLHDILDPDFDAHVFSGATIANRDYYELLSAYRVGDKEAKEIRQGGKPHTFKPLYGGQSGTEDEQRYYRAFRDRYTGVVSAQQEWVDGVLETGKLKTEWGLKYYWPDTRMDRSGYVKNTTAICNYPVQAFATAEIIPMAVVWFWHRLKRSSLRMFMVNTVHDSIIVELPPDEIEEFKELSRQSLIGDVYYTLRALYDIDVSVPLGADVSADTHWSVGEEVSYTAPREFWEEAAREAGMLE